MHTHPLPSPCACTTLRKASRAITRFYDEALETAGVTATQFAVMRAVERQGTVTMSHVAKTLVMDRTSFYRAVMPLVRDRLLRYARSTGDARAKCLAITPKGRARMAAAAKAWEDAQDRMVSRIGPQRWKQTAALLLTLADDVSTWTNDESDE